MSSEYEPDLELKAELDRSLTFPASTLTWSDVEERARKKGWVPEERWPLAAEDDEQIDGQKQKPMPKASAPRRTSGLRVAVFASIAVVLVAAVAIGSLEAVKHLGKDQPILVHHRRYPQPRGHRPDNPDDRDRGDHLRGNLATIAFERGGRGHYRAGHGSHRSRGAVRGN